MGLKMFLAAASRPPAPSEPVANQEPSGGVPAAARTLSLVVTSGSASMRLTVMLVWGVKEFLATWAYHWEWPVGEATPGRVRTSMVIGGLLAGAGVWVWPAPQAASQPAP